MGSKKFFTIFILISALFYSTEVHAIDKRLKLAFKTAGYGAAAGTLLGAGLWALKIIQPRQIFMGTSLGMYAGIGLAAYIIYFPPNKGGPSDKLLRKPRRPVGRDDWEEDPEYDKYMDMIDKRDGAFQFESEPPVSNQERFTLLAEFNTVTNHKLMPVLRSQVWVPMVSVVF